MYISAIYGYGYIRSLLPMYLAVPTKDIADISLLLLDTSVAVLLRMYLAVATKYLLYAATDVHIQAAYSTSSLSCSEI